jgi:hypothetical protein
MNLLEIVILHIFLVLFSMPSKPKAGDAVDIKSVETCGVERSFEGMQYTRSLHLEEDSPAIESSAGEKVHSNGGTVVSRPLISSSKPKITKRARTLPKPPSIIFPK